MREEKVKVFISSRFGEFEELRKLIIEQNFNREDIDVIALEAREYTTHQTPKEASIEYAQESDIYILFVGKTYGGCPQGEDKSYTHLEYISAVEKNMARIIFLFGDEYKNYGDISQIEDSDVRNWVKEIHEDKDTPIIKSFPTKISDEKIYEIIKKSLNNTTTNLTKKALYTKLSTENRYNEERLKKSIVQSFQEKDNSELLQKVILKYIPKHYNDDISTDIDKNIALLFEYGAYKDSIPILCVLKEFIEIYPHSPILKEVFSYFHDIKYDGIDYQCKTYESIDSCSFLIEFLRQEENQYTVTVWEYLKSEFTQIKKLPNSITFDKEGIKSVFDELFKFFNQPRYRGIDIYLEIILPLEKLALGIKSWSYSGKYRENKVISKYKYVLRVQDRFREVDIQWENSWEKIIYENSLLENSAVVLTREDECISEETICLLSEDKVQNMEDVLLDIAEYNISIALLPKSENIDSQIYRELCNKTVKKCKSVISTFILSNHSNENSDMLFLLDDPNKIPEQFKKSYENMYGFN